MEKSFEEAYEAYQELKDKVPNHGKGIMDLIKEDERLSKKITYEEAILMNPSLIDDNPNKEAILAELKKKYGIEEPDDIDAELMDAFLIYQNFKEVSSNKGKSVMDLIKEDEGLSEKITYEEALSRGYLTLEKSKKTTN